MSPELDDVVDDVVDDALDDAVDDALDMEELPFAPAPPAPCPLLPVLLLLMDESAAPCPPFSLGVGAWSSKHPPLVMKRPTGSKPIANKFREVMRSPAMDVKRPGWRDTRR
jgi:hypothetical protein